MAQWDEIVETQLDKDEILFEKIIEEAETELASFVRLKKETLSFLEKTEKEIETLSKKLELQRKRQEVGEITKAEFSKFKAKMDTKERELRSRIHRYQKLRVTRERRLKEKE